MHIETNFRDWRRICSTKSLPGMGKAKTAIGEPSREREREGVSAVSAAEAEKKGME